MSTPANSNKPDTLLLLHHDLGTVLANLRAFEYLFFSAAGSGSREDYRETYAELMTRLEAIVARIARMEPKSTAAATVEATPEAAR